MLQEILYQERHTGKRRIAILDGSRRVDIHHDCVDPRIDLARPRPRRLQQFSWLNLTGPDQLSQAHRVVSRVSVHVETLLVAAQRPSGPRLNAAWSTARRRDSPCLCCQGDAMSHLQTNEIDQMLSRITDFTHHDRVGSTANA
jgi:hypothetical protein